MPFNRFDADHRIEHEKRIETGGGQISPEKLNDGHSQMLQQFYPSDMPLDLRSGGINP